MKRTALNYLLIAAILPGIAFCAPPGGGDRDSDGGTVKESLGVTSLPIKNSKKGRTRMKALRKPFSTLVGFEKYEISAVATRMGVVGYYKHPFHAYDRNRKTSWRMRGRKQGIGEYILIDMHYADSPQTAYRKYFGNRQVLLAFKIVNGCAHDENSFKKHHRIRKAVLEIYEAEEGETRDFTPDIHSTPILNSRFKLDIKDGMKEQVFLMRTRPKHKPSNHYAGFRMMVKFTVTDLHRAKGARAACVNDIFFELLPHKK